jgi:cytochrome c-type biogenesis protein CcmH/NrfF
MRPALLLVLALVVAAPSTAQTTATETGPGVAREASSIANSLMSPFCPGMTLAACPSPNAAEVRTEISTRLHAGESRDAIVADLEQRFGDAVASAPRARGLGLLFWIAPAVMALALVAALAAVLRGGSPEDAPAPAPGPADAAWATRLDDELGDLD